MKASVASTSFNQKQSLIKLYNSLLENKDYLDIWSLWEDGSTDGSVELIKSWEKEGKIPMKVNYHSGRSGMGQRQNWIVQNCNDLFILVFGDSYLEPDGLKKLSQTYIDGTAGSGYRFDIDLDGNLVRNDFRFDPSDEVFCVMHQPNPWEKMCGNGFICRRKDLEAIGWFDEGYVGYGCDDYDWFMRLMMNGVKLYAYNNIKIYHHDHPAKTESPDSLKRFTQKLTGEGYVSPAKYVTLDFDDFSLEVNNLFYLDQLKKTFPQLKVSMFYVPLDADNYRRLLDFQRAEVVEMIKKRLDWIELIPHGLTHHGSEMMYVKGDDYETLFKGIEEGFRHYGFPMVKGFKAPHWAYKSNLVEFLDQNGWWLGVDRNQPDQPRAKRSYEYTHSIDEPFWLTNMEHIKLHGHISLPSKNNLVDNLMNLMKINPKAEFKFISECEF